MLLTVDIGNSYITMGGFAHENDNISDKLSFGVCLVTERRKTSDQYACELMQLLNLNEIEAKSIRAAILCSVVPELTEVLCTAVRKLIGIDTVVVGPGVKTGLNVMLDNPAQLGSEFVAEAVAASKMCSVPCIIFDLGTATSISVIDNKGRFRGGIISAGIGITLEFLASKTSLLPHINIERPKDVIGKNTIHSMQSGAVYGTAAMIDGMIDRIDEELGYPAKVIITGELASVVAPECRRPVMVEENLLHHGLRLIYLKNNVK